MASDYIIFTPSEDISIGHEIYPSTITNAYSVLNDYSDETYLMAYHPDENSLTYTSEFKMGSTMLPKAFQINALKTYFECKCASEKTSDFNVDVYINGTNVHTFSFESNSSSFQMKYNRDVDLLIPNAINTYLQENNYASFPEMSIKLTTTASTSPNTIKFSEIRLYLEYETEDENSRQNRIYLRPNEDISIGHEMIPADSGNAYSLINEEISDEESTHISCSCSKDDGNSQNIYTSSFKISGEVPLEKIKITDIKIIYNIAGRKYSSDTSNLTFTINANNMSIFETTSEATTGNYGNYFTFYLKFMNATDFITSINNNIDLNGIESFPNFTLTIDNEMVSTNTKTDVGCNLSQVYLALEYEIIEPTDMGIHYKSNGVYLPVTQAFHKQNGSWIEISAEECREILQT